MLEVLGAAALLAFAYIALTRSEIEGLRWEQEANRRLQASLLADARLADLELELAAGTSPPLGESEQKAEEPFRVRTDVRAFEPPKREEAPHTGPREGSLAARHAERAVDPNAPSLFAEPRLGAPDPNPPLRTIEVVVLWDEGIYEREVRRTTFFLDPVVAEELIAKAEAAAAPADATDEDEKGKDDASKKKPKSPTPEAPEPTAPSGGDPRLDRFVPRLPEAP
jgi:hypothetical protein